MPFRENIPTGLVCYIYDGPFHPFHVPVPLKNVQLDVKVVNFCCEVTVTQKYINCERTPIECIYNFPVEEEAAVVNFTAELEGRTIKTRVQEKSEARQEYREAVDNRQTAVLLEEIKQDIFEVKAATGDIPLGGKDFDNRVVDFCMQDFQAQEHGQGPGGNCQC